MSAGRNTVGVFVTFLSTWVVLFLGLGAMAIRARVLGPDDMGTVVWLLLVPLMAGSLVSLGLAGSITYSVRSLGRPLSGLLTTGILAGLLIGGLTSAVLALLIALGTLPTQGADTFSLGLMLLAVPFTLLERYLNAALLTVRFFLPYNYLHSGAAVLNLVLTVVLVWWASMGVLGAVAAFIATQVATIVGAATILGVKGHRPGRPLTKGLREFVGYGLKGHVGTIVQRFNLRLDQLLLGAFFPSSALALYAVAVRVVETLNSIPDSVGVVLFPTITGADRTWAAQATAWLLRVTILVMIAGGLAVAVLAPPLIPVIFGMEFQESVLPLLVALPGALFLAISKICSKFLNGIGRPGISSMSMVVGLLVGGTALVPLTRVWGLVGAAIASDLGYLAIAVTTLWWFMRLSSTSLVDCLIPRPQDAREVFRRVSSLRGSASHLGSPVAHEAHEAPLR